MNEFYFGKISKKYDPGQLTGGYYEAALSSSWFNGLQISDYVLVVGGDKVQFWQAKQYKGDRMEFNIIINDCGIKPQKLASLIYFKLDMELIIKSMRSTTKEKKAFFKLQPLPQFGMKLVNLLKNKSNYTNASNFRKIILYSDYSELQNDHNNRDNDIQLYYENGEIKLEKKGFIDIQLFNSFNGKIKSNSFIGGKNKSKIIKKFDLAGVKTKTVDVSMRDFYDVFISKQTPNTSSSNKGLPNGNNSNYNDDDVATDAPLNLILYGPPGTGKTYNTLFKALEIIEGKTREDLDKEKNEQDEKWKIDTNNPKKEKKGYEVLKERYDEYRNKGQIVFTTFHQSMSYEDFIEGIKPIPVNDEIIAIHENDVKSATTITQFGDGKTTINNLSRMKYKVSDGIFKQICNNAKKIEVKNTFAEIDFTKTRVFKMSLGEKGKDADYVFDYCVDNEVIALGWGGSKDFSKCTTKSDFKKLDSTWGATAIEIFKEWMKNGDVVLISDGTKEIKGIAQIEGNYEFRDDPVIDMHQFRKVKWLYAGDNIPISKLYDKSLSKQSIYGFYKEDKNGVINNGGIKVDVLNEIITGKINETEQDNYVLIIDEINRGNVAQIFGELITLIEENKRLGNKEAMTATLPYSQKPFGVPNNLYIIGTMNTADRSVEALDTALRRRFSFEEMMPKPELLKDEKQIPFEVCGVKLGDLLTTINARIVALKDREHQIGHSYFMGCPDKENDAKEWLKNVFKDKIIPLLQEYFYGDYKKIYYVLGPGFVEKKTDKTIFAIENPDYDEFDIPEERYDIVSFDAKFNIKDAIDKMKVQKLDSGTGTMSTEATTIETGATAESEESTDKE